MAGNDDTLWQPIETAPQDGTEFFAYQGGEIYVARYETDTKRPRLTYRTHSLFEGSKYRVIDAEMDGQTVKAQVPIEQPWREEFRHDWTIWQRGFEFAPTLWCPTPAFSQRGQSIHACPVNTHKP